MNLFISLRIPVFTCVVMLRNAAPSQASVTVVKTTGYAMTQVDFRLPYFRLGLERGTTAKEALDVIVALLEEHGQGGNYYEDAHACHSFQSAYLIVDCAEAWVLETVGKYWAAEQITGEQCGRGGASSTAGAEGGAAWTRRRHPAGTDRLWARSPLLGSASREEPGLRGWQPLRNTLLTFLIFLLLSGQDPVVAPGSFVIQMVRSVMWPRLWQLSHLRN